MAQDGLVFRSLGKVSEKYKTPVVGTLYAALVTGLFGATFDLQALVNMLSIGTLLAYTVVAISTIMLRFSDVQMAPMICETAKESSNLLRPGYNVTPKDLFRQVLNLNRPKYPNMISMSVVSILIVLYCLSALGLSLVTLYAKDLIINKDPVAITWLVIFGLISILLLILISIQPREFVESNFTVISLGR
jgi:amino acid transporter